MVSPNLTGFSVHMKATFPPSREIITVNNQEQLWNYIQSLQKLLVNLAAYRFHCKLTLNISLSYTSSMNVFMLLKKRNDSTTNLLNQFSNCCKGTIKTGSDKPGTTTLDRPIPLY